MRNSKSIKLNFRIDDDYLIAYTLSSMGKDRFSSVKHKKDIIAFQNYAWGKSKSCCKLIIGRFSAKEAIKSESWKTKRQLQSFLKELKNNDQYKTVRQQTEEYLKFCENQWDKNYALASETINDLTGLRLNKKFNVYITHPSLRNGSYRGNNVIEWGHNEDWQNYATIYLWHEILHSYIGWSDKEHAVIELMTDEELRTRLNNGKYPPFAGHKNLAKIKHKLLPRWKKYLNSKNKDIRKFIKEISQGIISKF